MLRRCFLILTLCLGARAAVWMDSPRVRGREALSPRDDRAVWDEFGFQSAERASFGAYRVAAYRFRDPTGAYAAAHWLAGQDPTAAAVGNYALTCSGRCPAGYALAAARLLSDVSGASAPTLGGYLPAKNRIPGSERFILGPVSLARFLPWLPAGAFAFAFSPEAETANYRAGPVTVSLTLVSYPTPQIARRQIAVLEKLPGVTTKRAGPLVAMAAGPDPAAAHRLLRQVGYEAAVTWDQPDKPLKLPPQSAAKLILGALELSGVLLVFCAVSGLVFGGIRVLFRRFGRQVAGEPITLLHLSDK